MLRGADARSPASSIRCSSPASRRSRFPAQANGSLIERDGKAVGSALIGQPFSDPKYFWGRAVGDRADALQRRRLERLEPGTAEPGARRCGRRRASRRCAPPIPDNTAPVPVDLVTASASGLDPHISPAAAEYQVARVAQGARPRRRSRCARWSPSTPKAGSSAFSASRASTCCKLNLALDARKP